MRRVVILGGGFGGLATATELVRLAGDAAEVVLVDRQPDFRMGFRKIWMLVGRAGPQDGARRRGTLAGQGIRVLEEEVRRIDLAGRSVHTTGRTLEWDYLVVALGAEPRPDLVPGFAGTAGAFNLYSPEGVLQARERLQDLARGRVLVSILGLPFKCPPAPYEAAMLLDEFFRSRGRREQVELVVTTPQPSSLPVAGPAACDAVESLLALKGIAFLPNRRPRRVDAGRIAFEEGEEPYDVLLGVPPHRPPAVVRESGLVGDGDWIRVDPRTLRTAFPGVFAIGDVTEIAMSNGAPLPKAGVFAEAQGRVVAAEIAAEIAGRPHGAAFDGRGECFIEVGGGMAAAVRGAFLAQPGPQVELATPSPAILEEKVRWEAERLRAWFGA